MKIKMYILIIEISIICGVIISCYSTDINKQTSNPIVTNDLKTIENFDSFYDKFHTDSVFQRSRIRNPLNGLRFDGEKEIHWTMDNQPYLATKIYDVDTSEYKISYKKTDSEFIEKVWIENSGFWSEYKFKLIKKKWYLVSALEHDL